MAISRVRIHSAEDFEGHPIDVIGLSRSASVDEEQLRGYFADQGQTVRRLPKGLAVWGGISTEYFMVHPPMANAEKIHDFGRVCVGGVEGGEYRAPLISYGDDGIVVFNNRHSDPAVYNPANIVASA